MGNKINCLSPAWSIHTSWEIVGSFHGRYIYIRHNSTLRVSWETIFVEPIKVENIIITRISCKQIRSNIEWKWSCEGQITNTYPTYLKIAIETAIQKSLKKSEKFEKLFYKSYLIYIYFLEMLTFTKEFFNERFYFFLSLIWTNSFASRLIHFYPKKFGS